MNTDRLFLLIQSLSPSEKTAVNRSLRARNTQDALLYERFLECIRKGESCDSPVRDPEFQSNQKYYQYRNILAERILRILAQIEDPNIPIVPFLVLSIEHDFLEIGRKALISEMKRANKWEDYARLLFLHDAKSKVENVYRISIDIPSKTPLKDPAISKFNLHLRLEGLQNEIRNSFYKPMAERRFLANRLIQSLENLTCGTRTSRILKKKVQIGISRLQEKHQKGFSLREEFINEIIAWKDKFKPTSLIRELQSAAIHATLVGDSFKSVHYAMMLSKIETGTIAEELFLKEVSIDLQIRIGEHQANIELIQSGYIELDANQSHLPVKKVGKLLLLSALGFSYHEDFERASNILSNLINLPRKELTGVFWEAKMLQVICHFEKGNIEILDSLMNSLKKLVAKKGLPYPVMAVRILKRYICGLPPERPAIARNGLNELKPIPKPTEEFNFIGFLEFELWLKSKSNSIPMLQLIEGPEKRILKMTS